MNKQVKKLGQVFTPQWIIELILEKINYNNKESILKKYILEPSTGKGYFLNEIVKRYIETSLSNSLSTNEIINDLETYIYGFEIDEELYNITIDSLNKLVIKKLGYTNQINWKIFNTNTFNIYKEYINYFDYIIGNPPYVRIHNIDNETKEFVKNNLKLIKGSYDMYVCFFEISLEMLNKTGVIGFITPNSYITNHSYKLYRKHIQDNNLLTTLINFKSFNIFENFSTYSAITILNKNNKDNFFEYYEYNNNKIELINLYNINDVNSDKWILTNDNNNKFITDITDINDKPKIKDYFDVQYGFATLRDKIFISKIKYNDENTVLFNDYVIEKDLLKTIIKISTFKGIIDYNTKIIYPYKLIDGKYIIIDEDEMKEFYPKTYDYFLLNKTELDKRDSDKNSMWYAFGRSQGVQKMNNEKIIIKNIIKNNIEYYKIDKDILSYSGIFVTTNQDKYKLEQIYKTLDSDKLIDFIKLSSKDVSGGYLNMNTKQIKEFNLCL